MNKMAAKFVAITMFGFFSSGAMAQVVLNSELVTVGTFGGASLKEGESKIVKLGRKALIEKVTLSLQTKTLENQIVNVLVNGRIRGSINLPLTNGTNDVYVSETASEIEVMLASGKKVELQGAIFLWSGNAEVERAQTAKVVEVNPAKANSAKVAGNLAKPRDERVVMRIRDALKPISRIMTTTQRNQIVSPIDDAIKALEEDFKIGAPESNIQQAKADLLRRLELLIPMLDEWMESNETFIARNASNLNDAILEFKKSIVR